MLPCFASSQDCSTSLLRTKASCGVTDSLCGAQEPNRVEPCELGVPGSQCGEPACAAAGQRTAPLEGGERTGGCAGVWA